MTYELQEGLRELLGRLIDWALIWVVLGFLFKRVAETSNPEGTKVIRLDLAWTWLGIGLLGVVLNLARSYDLLVAMAIAYLKGGA